MFKRGWRYLAALVFLVGGISAWIAFVNQDPSEPGRAIVQSSAMDYCRSTANTSPDKEAQLTFLRRNHLFVGQGWIDVEVARREGTVAVRYFYGEEQGASRRCRFGISAPNREVEATTVTYIRYGGKYLPPAGQRCVSTAPPNIGARPVIMRCDEVA